MLRPFASNFLESFKVLPAVTGTTSTYPHLLATETDRETERERESGRETERIHIDASLHQLADTVDGTRSQNKSSTQMDVVTDRAGRRREINR